MRTGNSLAQYRRSCRFNRHYLYVFDFFFKELARSRKRSARSDARYEVIDVAVGIGVYFGTGGFVMRQRICRIDKLTENYRVRSERSYFLCLCYGTFHALCAFAEFDFRSVAFNKLSAFYRHGFGHSENNTVAFCRTYCGKTYSGVAGSGFHYYRAGL